MFESTFLCFGIYILLLVAIMGLFILLGMKKKAFEIQMDPGTMQTYINATADALRSKGWDVSIDAGKGKLTVRKNIWVSCRIWFIAGVGKVEVHYSDHLQILPWLVQFILLLSGLLLGVIVGLLNWFLSKNFATSEVLPFIKSIAPASGGTTPGSSYIPAGSQPPVQ